VKPSEIRERPTAELERTVGELKEEVFRLRFRHGTGQLKQTASMRNAKRDLARVKTELVRRAAAEAQKGAAKP
jgi:large subunit ribosomal protein L29